MMGLSLVNRLVDPPTARDFPGQNLNLNRCSIPLHLMWVGQAQRNSCRQPLRCVQGGDLDIVDDDPTAHFAKCATTSRGPTAKTTATNVAGIPSLRLRVIQGFPE
jgi:hypothetical protein